MTGLNDELILTNWNLGYSLVHIIYDSVKTMSLRDLHVSLTEVWLSQRAPGSVYVSTSVALA
jgi:hypothetical protein